MRTDFIMKSITKLLLSVMMVFMWMIIGCAPQSQTITKLSGSNSIEGKIVALSAGTSYSFALTDRGDVLPGAVISLVNSVRETRMRHYCLQK